MTYRGALQIPALVAVIVMAGCRTTLKEVTDVPSMSPPDFSNVSSISPGSSDLGDSMTHHPNSTWSPTSRDLFRNRQALNEGDILTIQIAMNDKAQLTNRSNRNRTGNKSLGVDGSFDLAGAGSSAGLNASLANATDFSGNGGTARSENINLSVAAAIKSVLPNGNLLIVGSQEVRVNAELRILHVTGIVRPSDIQPNNTVSYERIAEARISYGGRGLITEVQQPAYGQAILDWLSPL